MQHSDRQSVRPRVLVLNRSYWPDAEATGQLLTELCEDLAADFDVAVLAGRPNQNPADISWKSVGTEQRAGVTIHRVPHLRLGKRFLFLRGLNLLSYVVIAGITAFFLRRPAVVVVETDPFLLPLLGRVLRWRHQCRLVVYLQDIYPDIAIALGKVRDGWFTRILRRLLFDVYRHADRVVVLGEDMRRVLTAAGIETEKIASLANWADTTRIYPVREQNEFRRREGLDGRFVVMYSGNMGLCQNLEETLEAANRLRERQAIQFLFVGDGASRARLERTARDRNLSNVRFLPYQPKSELAQSLSAADVHLVPLDPRVTGCLVPSKLYGILAAGVPSLVVADEHCQISRIVQESATGRVIPPGNPETLAQTIAWCADHPDELRAMGRRARDLALREYDRKIATGRFADLLRDTIAGPCAPPQSRAAAVAAESSPLVDWTSG